MVFSGFAKDSLQIRKDGKSPSMPRTPSPRTMAADPQLKGKKLVLEKIGPKVRQIAQKCTLLASKMGQCLLFYFFLVPRFFVVLIFFLSWNFPGYFPWLYFGSILHHFPSLILFCPPLTIKFANLGVKPCIGPLCPGGPPPKRWKLSWFFFWQKIAKKRP